MHELIKFFGGIVALAGAAGIALAVYLKLNPALAAAPVSEIHAAIYGVSVLIAGILLYSLGAVIDHLSAIRDFQRRQIEIFERMGKKRAASASDTTNAATDSVANAAADNAQSAASDSDQGTPSESASSLNDSSRSGSSQSASSLSASSQNDEDQPEAVTKRAS